MGSKTPNPGSAEAIKRGCKCPVIDNHHGNGVPHGKDGAPLFWISERCSMHMTDRALEAAAREIAANHWSVDSNMDKQAYQDAHGLFHVDDAKAAISAYLSALPGEAGVVAFMHPTANWAHVQYSEIDIHCQKDGPHPIPLVTLASLQAMRARAEKAEREYEKVLNSYADENQRLSDAAEAAEARVKDAMGLLDHLIGWIVHDCGAEPPFTSEQDETYAALCAVAKALQVSR